jgi:hypothetical protein
MNVRILTSAVNDLIASREFYESQAEGIGAEFLEALFSDIDLLSTYGGVHRKFEGFHRMLARRFPYAIYYKMNTGGSVVVYRVLDCRQDPAKIKRGLRAL